MSEKPFAIACLTCLLLAACYSSDEKPDADAGAEADALDADADTGTDMPDADATTEIDVTDEDAGDPLPDGTADPCERDPLECDAIYIPFVTFIFTDTSTGESYCGPAAISFLSECDRTGDASCECVGGFMVESGSMDFRCHVNPPEGETSTITVTVEGYRDFIQDVTLPWECHPTAEVDVLLEPL